MTLEVELILHSRLQGNIEGSLYFRKESRYENIKHIPLVHVLLTSLRSSLLNFRDRNTFANYNNLCTLPSNTNKVYTKGQEYKYEQL
jgi:hypothetical protein